MDIINRESIKKFSQEVNKKVKEIGEKNNLEVFPRGGTFSSTDFTLRFDFALKGSLRREEKDYDETCEKFSLPERGTKFMYGLAEYKIWGWNYRAREYPVIVMKTDTGVKYKYSIEEIKKKLTN